ncbi:MAG: hypothetical protein NTW02_02015 [Cyanobium sp. LacPavin_0920_WC12_MAG_62_9]|nr:hypothetical protein [Cyanobium sp. LacPavin_0920_WC12_MAG_62_9]
MHREGDQAHNQQVEQLQRRGRGRPNLGDQPGPTLGLTHLSWHHRQQPGHHHHQRHAEDRGDRISGTQQERHRQHRSQLPPGARTEKQPSQRGVQLPRLLQDHQQG